MLKIWKRKKTEFEISNYTKEKERVKQSLYSIYSLTTKLKILFLFSKISYPNYKSQVLKYM